MHESRIFICTICQAEFHSDEQDTPAGWARRGSHLLCPDCLRTAAFSHGHDSARADGTPTPTKGSNQ